MSVIRKYESPIFGDLHVEFYGSANEMADDLVNRKRSDHRFEDDEYEDRSFVGASRDEAYKMLRSGYQPVVDSLKEKIKIYGKDKRFKSHNDVVGFAPVVPNAIMGLPKSMVNNVIKPIKTKVIDLYYDMTASCAIDSDDIIKAGEKMLSVILAMEAAGYRFNLYTTQNYYDDCNGCDMVCVKVKSANQPFDLKRMSFPAAHTAFFRGIGFEWYSKFPIGRYRYGYGHSIFREKEREEVQEEYRRLFGDNIFCFSATDIIREGDEADEYIRRILRDEPKRKER